MFFAIDEFDADNNLVVRRCDQCWTGKVIEGKEDDLPLCQVSIAYNQETTSDYDREELQKRLAKLAGGAAVISVGAATEAEMKEKKARVEDA